jgi:hypothetical protein
MYVSIQSDSEPDPESLYVRSDSPDSFRSTTLLAKFAVISNLWGGTRMPQFLFKTWPVVCVSTHSYEGKNFSRIFVYIFWFSHKVSIKRKIVLKWIPARLDFYQYQFLMFYIN